MRGKNRIITTVAVTKKNQIQLAELSFFSLFIEKDQLYMVIKSEFTNANLRKFSDGVLCRQKYLNSGLGSLTRKSIQIYLTFYVRWEPSKGNEDPMKELNLSVFIIGLIECKVMKRYDGNIYSSYK